MRMKCERAVEEIFPVSRAMIALKLIKDYGFSQTKAAKRMGISQPAVSQYAKRIRGRRRFEFTKSPEYRSLVDEIAKGLAEGSITEESIGNAMCRLCKAVQGDG